MRSSINDYLLVLIYFIEDVDLLSLGEWRFLPCSLIVSGSLPRCATQLDSDNSDYRDGWVDVTRYMSH